MPSRSCFFRRLIWTGWTCNGLAGSATVLALLGGLALSDHHVIAGNKTGGIRIESGGSGNTIAGNFTGTNAAGTAAIGNMGYGVEVIDSPSNVIGGDVVDLLDGSTVIATTTLGWDGRTSSRTPRACRISGPTHFRHGSATRSA